MLRGRKLSVTPYPCKVWRGRRPRRTLHGRLKVIPTRPKAEEGLLSGATITFTHLVSGQLLGLLLGLGSGLGLGLVLELGFSRSVTIPTLQQYCHTCDSVTMWQCDKLAVRSKKGVVTFESDILVTFLGLTLLSVIFWGHFWVWNFWVWQIFGVWQCDKITVRSD